MGGADSGVWEETYLAHWRCNMAKAKKTTRAERDRASRRKASRELELVLLRDGVKNRSTVLSRSKAQTNKAACRRKGRVVKEEF